jgi:hypothetical protein
MNIEGTINKVLNPIEKHGQLIGAGAMVMMTPNAISDIQSSITNLIGGNLHAPNMSNIISNLQNEKKNWTPALFAAIAGYFLEDATDNRTIKTVAGAAKKFGIGWLEAYAIYLVLFFSTHSAQGCEKDGYVKDKPNLNGVSSCSNYMARSIS